MSETREICVYLSACGSSQAYLRSELEQVLLRAGIRVVPAEGIYDPSKNEQFINSLQQANCSIHIIFSEFSPATDSGTSATAWQLEEAKKRSSVDPAFKIFTWLPPSTVPEKAEPAQAALINEIRNNISKNMVFSNAPSALRLVDDIRSQMEFAETEIYNVNATDIFLVSNQLDESEANEIIDMLSDIVPVEKLNIIQDSDTDYSELCKQQIAKSKLAVIYFKESGDWALPFAQQVWKKIGGATSHTPILLIGDDDPESNLNKKFKAPKVISLIVAGQLIPLEIKVQFDKVVEVK